MFGEFSVLSVDVWAAFIAGVATFFTPCILPVIPGFIAYFIADTGGKTTKTIVNAVGFVVGLSFVFINLGILSAYIGNLIESYRLWVNIVAGAVVVMFGLHIAGVVRIPLLGRTGFNVRVRNDRKSFWSAFLLGLAFSVVWTPCLSPTLGAILVIASKSSDIFRGAYLLFFYSLGMGMLFIIVAVAVKRLMFIVSAMQRYQRKVEVATGIMLVIIGIIIALGQFDRLALVI